MIPEAMRHGHEDYRMHAVEDVATIRKAFSDLSGRAQRAQTSQKRFLKEVVMCILPS